MLTNYNGTAITYDAIGNPNNWHNSSSLTWEGRQLVGQTIKYLDDRFTYTYNSDGIRTQKKYYDNDFCGYYTYDYVLDGTKIIQETAYIDSTKQYTLYYLYDASGSVQGFIYNNQYYYFQKNLQGDVVRILNSSGAVVTEYTYDAWGKVLTTTGSLASTVGRYNPFRYRSYYYDVETGFYYLQSRYYDPTVGRFLNADGIVGANGGIEGYNMFAYCNNNPVMFVDYSGCALTYNVMMSDGGKSPFSGLRDKLIGTGITANDAAYIASCVYSQRALGDTGTILVAYETGGPDYGQYGSGDAVEIDYAATIFVIEGTTVTRTYTASTLPQFTVSKEYGNKGGVATLANGKYTYTYYKKYAGKVNSYLVTLYGTDNKYLPCVRWDKKTSKFIASTANNIMIHSGTKYSNYNNPTSMGCIIVEGSWTNFYDFVGCDTGTLFVFGPNRYVIDRRIPKR